MNNKSERNSTTLHQYSEKRELYYLVGKSIIWQNYCKDFKKKHNWLWANHATQQNEKQ